MNYGIYPRRPRQILVGFALVLILGSLALAVSSWILFVHDTQAELINQKQAFMELKMVTVKDEELKEDRVFVMLVRNPTNVTKVCTMFHSLSVVLNQRKYPIIVFHEGVMDTTSQRELSLCFGGGRVLFQSVVLPLFEIRQMWDPFCVRVSLGYRGMCHFFSKELFEMPVLKHVKLIARVDEDSEFFPPSFDVFDYMETQHLDYTFAVRWWKDHCVKDLLSEVEKYARARELTLDWKSEKLPAVMYNNFFAARKELFLDIKYQHFMSHIDSLEGIWTKRWGDAPIHTSAAALFGWNSYRFTSDQFGYCHQGVCVRDKSNKPVKKS